MEQGARIEEEKHLGQAADRRGRPPLQARAGRAFGQELGTLLLLREEDVESRPELGEAAGPPSSGAGARASWPSAVALRDLVW